MNLSVGIVGLPNVGKSTLFNALLKKQQALAANYPFATIEPNIGVVPVPDARLTTLAEIVATKELHLNPLPMGEGQGVRVGWPPLKPATVEFVDIAGLVKGASEGAGLGNKFLSHIREVKVIAHVVRAFEDPDVVREGSVSPDEDYKTIQMELIYADMQTLQKTIDNRKIDAVKKSAAMKLLKEMNGGTRAFDVSLTDEERVAITDLFLLTSKPEIIVLNVTEDQYTEENIPKVIEEYKKLLFPVIANGVKQSDIDKIAASSRLGGTPRNDNVVVICAKVEAELAELSSEEQKLYLEDLGISESGLERLIRKAYELLGLISFLTAGEKEVRAWTCRKGANAVEASGEIHTDFMKRFIKAEVISYDDYVSVGGRKKAREVGKARLEGRDYVVQDGDVIEFKIGS
ncbi:MAG: redox-regulated ATPase YchF [bacterium]|nr:redox-regulated ATPase YchF [bacterium]